jgi:hypothetical protein
MMIGRASMVATAAAIVMLAGSQQTAQAHHDNWGLPLIGGLVGGYAAKSLLDAHSRDEHEARPAPAPAEAPAAAGPSATSIEDKLNTLDKLAAGGYITKDEYNARRQALLNAL